MQKLRVAVVGATGIAGQQFLVALARPSVVRDHGAGRLGALGRASRTARRSATRTAPRRWWCREEPPAERLGAAGAGRASTLDADGRSTSSSPRSRATPARELEPRYAASRARAQHGVGVSATRPTCRSSCPGVNLAAHVPLHRAPAQATRLEGLRAAAVELHDVGLVDRRSKPHRRRASASTRVLLTSMQGISGAGRSPGVVALDILDNVVPYIPKEEEKVATRGRRRSSAVSARARIEPHPALVGATCTRAAVLDGHTAAVAVETERPCIAAEAAAAMREFRGDYAGMDLPSAPTRPIIVHDDPFRPQPRLDRDADGGMTTTVGRAAAGARAAERAQVRRAVAQHAPRRRQGGLVLDGRVPAPRRRRSSSRPSRRPTRGRDRDTPRSAARAPCRSSRRDP